MKSAALQWGIQRGYRAIAEEVRLPNSNFRADAAGCKLERPAPRELVIASTVAFECKQVRSDFLNDSFREEESLVRLKKLRLRREKLRAMISGHYPNHCQGDLLFPEFDEPDPSLIRHDGYRKLNAEITVLERGIFARTKFEKMIRYRCVDLCYLVICQGVAEPCEIPAGWGLLECELSESGEEPVLRETKVPNWLEAAPVHRLELLHTLARMSTPSTTQPQAEG